MDSPASEEGSVICECAAIKYGVARGEVDSPTEVTRVVRKFSICKCMDCTCPYKTTRPPGPDAILSSKRTVGNWWVAIMLEDESPRI